MEITEVKSKEYIVKLTEVRVLYPSVKLFRFEFEEEFHFIPGQFVMLGVKDKEGNVLKRSYSISSLPNKKNIDLCMNILSEGKLTPLLDKLEIGDKINLYGPYGKFGKDIEKSNKSIIFIATGTGITPIKCLIDHLLKSKFSNKITLIYGFRHEERYLFKKELESLGKKNKNMKIIPIISQPYFPNKWKNKIGRVQDIIPKLELNEDQEFYLCGLIEMVKETRALLKSKGINPEKIHTETFI